NKLKKNLRIGSSYHVGTSFQPDPFYPPVNSSSLTSESHAKQYPLTATESAAFVRNPLSLIRGREQGHIGASPKGQYLCAHYSGWRTTGPKRPDGLLVFGGRKYGTCNWPAPLTFQERILGSLWAVTRLQHENLFKVS
ncbi:unnamed protein product, partial [Protopolystoma xenopodis]